MISGEGGTDWLDGGDGKDTIDGGEGMDFITGGRGNDTLSGGSGPDVFYFAEGDGDDYITDFNPEQDSFSIQGVTLEDVNITEGINASTGETYSIVNYGDGDSITFAGVEADSLTDFFA